MLRVAFHQAQQIRRQVVATLKLYGNAAPGFVFETSQGDKAVIGHHDPDEDDNEDGEADIHFHMQDP